MQAPGPCCKVMHDCNSCWMGISGGGRPDRLCDNAERSRRSGHAIPCHGSDQVALGIGEGQAD